MVTTTPTVTSTGTVTVRKVESKEDYKIFLEFPWTHYKNDANWIPPLVSTRRKILDKHHNPSWEYMEGDYFIAWRGSQPIGTIAAFINHRHNETWNEKIGWFGFFESPDDQTVANALLQTAADYVKKAGPYTGMRGPANFTCNDEWGLLIENFDPPVLLMPYNPPYYQRLIENSGMGFGKVMDVVSYYNHPSMYQTENGHIEEKLKRIVQMSMERNKVTIRKPDAKNLRAELVLLRDIYASAWEKNWGNVPPTAHEIDALFTDLKDLFDPDLGLFAYVDGKPAGFFLSLPDLNQALRLSYPNPKEPEIFTLLKTLWHWKIRPKINTQRVVLFGVKPEFRRLGVDGALFLYFMEKTITSKYPNIDAGWILETNRPVHQLAERFNAKIYKRYRFYQRALD